MKRLLLLVASILCCTCLCAQQAMRAPRGGKAISDRLIGLFFEDINSSADGGLWPEMVRNNSFEYNGTERDGWGPSTFWQLQRPGHSLGYMEHRQQAPLHPDNPNYMRLHVERVGHFSDYAGWTGVGLQNRGWNGMLLREGARYNFSAWCRNPDGKDKTLRIALVKPVRKDGDPELVADTTIRISGGEWRKYACRLTAPRTVEEGALQVLVTETGDVDIDMVSLLPDDTYKGHGLRRDMAEALEALHPRFVRFPGGCVVHSGEGFWNFYRWKSSVGPLERRKATKNTWGYHQSKALGYYEYFQLCEDLGAEPLPILPCGVTCQGTNGTWGLKEQGQDAVPMEAMEEWVDEALDLVEWANGDADSPWGRIRAEAGHPEPFGLKYIGLGNEEKISPAFAERFALVCERLRRAHPEIVIVGTAGAGSHPGNADYEAGWRLAGELDIPLIDEHYYERDAFFRSCRQYDDYPRDRKTKVYIGEYAAKDRRLIDALSEALYLLHVERNADVVEMTSYAPLFARVGAENWNPDLIYFDNEHVYPTCSYYVQQIFGQSAGQYYYGDCVRIEDPDPTEGRGMLQEQSVVLNVVGRRLYVKMCNAGAREKRATVDLSRFPIRPDAVKTLLQGAPEDRNTDKAQPVRPVTEPVRVQKRMEVVLPPYTLMMLTIKL